MKALSARTAVRAARRGVARGFTIIEVLVAGFDVTDRKSVV